MMECRKKILFITHAHLYDKTPNASCALNIIESLVKMGASVTVVSDPKKKDLSETEKACFPTEIEYVEVSDKCRNNFINQALRLIYWPAVNPHSIFAKQKKCEELLKKKKFDAVISIQKPYEASETARRLKKKHPELTFIEYEIDPASNEIDIRLGAGKFLFPLSLFAEKRLFEFADYIIHMDSNKEHFSKQKYAKYESKSFYTGLPLLNDKPDHVEDKLCTLGTPTDYIYSGILDLDYRSPKYLLSLFEKLGEKHSINFYSKGNAEELVRESSTQNANIRQCGFVTKDVMEKAYAKADVLVNICNKYSQMLPSKLFVYMQEGKPVLHVTNRDDDPCVKVLECYRNAIIVDERESIEVNLKKINDYLASGTYTPVLNDELRETFELYTPERSAKIICNLLNK